MKHILLVNPWIHDFAAYDMWLKPWGLLKLSSTLKKQGFNITLVDLLDRHHKAFDQSIIDRYDGTGKFYSEIIKKPDVLDNIHRNYRRYGLPINKFSDNLPDKVDYILMTSGMTYWYLGVFEAIKLLKNHYKGVPLVLGGTYATLCYDHAVKNSGADYVIKNNVGVQNLEPLQSILGIDCDMSDRAILDESIDYSHYKNPPYGVVRLSLGCPYDCVYCAQKQLSSTFIQKDIGKAFAEIDELASRGISKFAFYDDALFYNPSHIKKYLSRVIKSGMTTEFYSPNGLHARFIDEELAWLMWDSGFINPILSLETVDPGKERTWHNKVDSQDFVKASKNLLHAGYKRGEFSSYVLLGAPGSNIDDVKKTIDFAHSHGANVFLSEYAPTPGTIMFNQFKKIVHNEPLLQNNSIFPSFSSGSISAVNKLKRYALSLNNGFVEKVVD
jgi:radical SAM family protein